MPCRKYAIGAGMLMLIMALLQLPIPMLTKYAVDTVFPSGNVKLLTAIVAVLFLLLIISILSNTFTSLLLFLFREKTLLDIQYKLFEHIEHLSMSFHNDKGIGYVQSRIGNDASRLQGLMADTILYALQNCIIFVIGIGALLLIHWRLALLSLLLIPFFIFSVYHFSYRIRDKSDKMYDVMAKLSQILCEAIYCLPLIKAFSLEDAQLKKIHNALMMSFHANLGLTKISTTATLIIGFISGFGPLLILWYGGHEIMKGHLTIGGFIAFNAYLGYLFGPIQIVMGLYLTIQSSITALHRVFELFDEPSEDDGHDYATKPIGFFNTIKFSNITFSYDGNEPIIKNLNLTIAKGEKIALVGRTGSGKTTLMNLLLKLYKQQTGAITIDNIDINTIKSSKLRSLIGIVQQNPIIISGSIKDNIKISKATASDEEICWAAEIAHLGNMISSLPLKYDTEVGERGVKLSGGECQQIAIARAVLKQADIIVFDEATSEIDAATERHIYNNMLKKVRFKAFIIITHRLFNILRLDRIVFMENGRITSSGSHDYLYRNLQSYHRLYNDQVCFCDSNG